MITSPGRLNVPSVTLTVLLSGKDFHIEAIEEDLYAAIDALVDKLDRQLQKHKQKLQDHHRGQRVNQID